MRAERFIERPDYRAILDKVGFKPRSTTRRHVIQVFAFVIMNCVLIVAVLMLTSRMMLAPVDEALSYDQISIVVFSLKCLLIVFGTITCFALLKLRDMILVAEFQNVLFSSAMRAHTSFSLIINADQKVVYADQTFSDIFRNQRENGLREMEVLLAYEGLGEQNRDKIEHAILNGEEASVPFDIMESDAVKEKLTLKLEPLNRPEGFFVLRAYPR